MWTKNLKLSVGLRQFLRITLCRQHTEVKIVLYDVYLSLQCRSSKIHPQHRLNTLKKEKEINSRPVLLQDSIQNFRLR